MKKLLTSFTVLMVISVSATVVSCAGIETRDRSKIYLSLFKSELALIPVFETQQPTTKVTETIFQNVIYDSLETNEYHGEIPSDELKFIYYDKDGISKLWTDLTWQPLASGGAKTALLWVQIIVNKNSTHFAYKTDIISITLYQTQPLVLDTITFNYEAKMLKSLPIEDMMSYFAILNPTFYFSPRHFTITKTTDHVIIKASSTSNRYRGENLINV
ncbi:hypothetical protein [Spiroplasma endosymbiont of Poecilobothrus nobilitatus]|uniref:hypothetical protein n=1 Tax=Spiroplasma endosymbiont of Poecilobothrus nobilitatus TaxID=1209220 RepID=UPI00313C9B29